MDQWFWWFFIPHGHLDEYLGMILLDGLGKFIQDSSITPGGIHESKATILVVENLLFQGQNIAPKNIRPRIISTWFMHNSQNLSIKTHYFNQIQLQHDEAQIQQVKNLFVHQARSPTLCESKSLTISFSSTSCPSSWSSLVTSCGAIRGHLHWKSVFGFYKPNQTTQKEWLVISMSISYYLQQKAALEFGICRNLMHFYMGMMYIWLKS